MMRRIMLGICFGLVMAGPAFADTLDDVLAMTYQNNPTLLAKQAELRVIDEGVPQAMAGWRPTITATGDVTYSDSRSEVSGFGGLAFVTEGDNTAKSVAVRLTQPLFRGFRTVEGVEEAEHLVRAGRADLWVTEQQVLLDAVTVYMDVLRDLAVLDLNVNNEQVLRRQLDATTDRFDVGELTRTDIAQAESRLARATADRVGAEGDLDSSRATFVQVVGALPGRLDQPPPFAGLPATLEEAQSLAASGNPAVIAALYLERAAEDAVDIAFGELLPEVNIVGEWSRAFDPSLTTLESESTSIGAEVTIPLYQAGSVSSRVRAAKQLVSQRRLEIVEAKRQAIETVTQAWETLDSTRAQVVAFEEEARSTAIALEGVQEENFAGLRTVLDVLDAEQEFLDARVSLVGARRDEVVASFALLAAVGGLTAENLELAVTLYNPESYYTSIRNAIWGLGEDPIPMPVE